MIDLRSDTVTRPTQAMREAMKYADVGDDVYKDDPTINALEAYAAKLTGKEAALFVPSGTFGNQLSLFTHCERGQEVILGDDCHIVKYEAGASAIIAGVQLRTITPDQGQMSISKIESLIHKQSLHNPKTALICLENATSNGRVLPLSYMKEVADVAKDHGVPIHLDGARLFNAALCLGVEASDLAGYADSVMFCLSKGLCGPIGSILAGSREFIDKALYKRKIMGGGMRQAGVLGAAGLIALEQMTGRLIEDHHNARLLGEKMNRLPGVAVNLNDIHINMVFAQIKKRIEPEKMVSFFKNQHIIINPPDKGIIRFVLHNDVKGSDIDRIVEVLKSFLEN